ncbi:MAG: asparaginase [Bacteroidetes bacterium]|nr:MAG: asparaginase [Bacteroidota bacterium]
MFIKIFTTGGTIDKVYFDAKSEYEVGEPQIVDILREANVTVDYAVETLFRKDSLELTDADRAVIVDRVRNDPARHVLITHGTDTMVETARALRGIPDKTIVLVGSLSPARFKHTDAEFNVGFAMATVQAMPPGVYLAMNGRIFEPEKVRKNRAMNRFEPV